MDVDIDISRVLLNQTDYHWKMLLLRSDKNIYVALKGDPARGYSKMVIDCLTQLENDNPMDCRGKLHQVCTENLNATQPLAQFFWIIPGWK